MKYPITIQDQVGSIEIPIQWLQMFASDQELANGEKRFEATTKAVTGLAMEPINGTTRPGDPIIAWKIWGVRTMHQCSYLGYDMEGIVSIQGKKRRAFTSSKLFRYYDHSVGDYRLFNCAILYICKLYS